MSAAPVHRSDVWGSRRLNPQRQSRVVGENAIPLVGPVASSFFSDDGAPSASSARHNLPVETWRRERLVREEGEATSHFCRFNQCEDASLSLRVGHASPPSRCDSGRGSWCRSLLPRSAFTGVRFPEDTWEGGALAGRALCCVYGIFVQRGAARRRPARARGERMDERINRGAGARLIRSRPRRPVDLRPLLRASCCRCSPAAGSPGTAAPRRRRRCRCSS